jgi:hypothetical protein
MDEAKLLGPEVDPAGFCINSRILIQAREASFCLHLLDVGVLSCLVKETDHLSDPSPEGFGDFHAIAQVAFEFSP